MLELEPHLLAQLLERLSNVGVFVCRLVQPRLLVHVQGACMLGACTVPAQCLHCVLSISCGHPCACTVALHMQPCLLELDLL